MHATKKDIARSTVTTGQTDRQPERERLSEVERYDGTDGQRDRQTDGRADIAGSTDTSGQTNRQTDGQT